MAFARTSRIRPLTDTFRSYPITSAISAESHLREPNYTGHESLNSNGFDFYCVVEYEVSVMTQPLIGRPQPRSVEVSEATYIAVKGYLASIAPVSTH